MPTMRDFGANRDFGRRDWQSDILRKSVSRPRELPLSK